MAPKLNWKFAGVAADFLKWQALAQRYADLTTGGVAGAFGAGTFGALGASSGGFTVFIFDPIIAP